MKTAEPVLTGYIEEHWPYVLKIIRKNVGFLPSSGRDVASHILNVRGKRLRPALLLLSGQAFGLEPQELFPLAAAVELAHTASLLHDDLEDESLLRRGQPSAHTIFGPKGALLAGDSLLALAMCICTSEYGPDICKCFSSALLKTASGQIKELSKVDGLYEYFDIILLKTGSLMGCSCEMAGLLAKQKKEICLALREFGENLGAAYQIADDWKDFAPSEVTGKSQCRDLLKGNATLPVRLFMKSLGPEAGNNFMAALQKQLSSGESCIEIYNAMQAQGIGSHISSHINHFLKKAEKNLSFIPESKQKNILVHIAEQTRNAQQGF